MSPRKKKDERPDETQDYELGDEPEVDEKAPGEEPAEEPLDDEELEGERRSPSSRS